MMRLRAVPVLIASCLLFFAASAYGDCAWLLWSEDNVITADPPDMRTLWTFIQVETTKKTCEEARGLRLAGAKKRGASVDGQGSIFPEVNRMVRYLCAPDTIDPREPKTK